MPSLVAFDLETTGLNPKQDAIIEIGAIRFNENHVENEFSMLIDPERRIPSFITQLTGISNEMVRGAAHIHDVIAEFEAFVGDAPVVGHNVRFDLGFMQRHNILQHNDVIDTYEMAAVLLPSAGRYKLGALSQLLGIPLQNAHRALDDAKATQGIFARLYGMAESLPIELIAEIVRQGEPLDWDANWVFQQILKAKSKRGIQLKRGAPEPLFDARPSDKYPPLQPISTPIKLDPEEASSALEHGGAFSKYFEHYEFRNEQVEMLQVVADAFSNSRHFLIEAGTGVGKSFAYLVPAALWAMQNNTRVVISTNTINLQDQLIKKDIPDLAAALDIDLRASVMKGRGNYLCPRLFNILRRRGPRNKEEMRVLAKILVWLRENQSGDKAEINLTGPDERAVWRRVSAEDDACTADNCIKHTGGSCPFYRAKQAAQSAHILIVNHALLLADIASGSRVLPEYDYLIIDEAHHLESATTNSLSFKLTPSDMNRLMRELGGSKSGALGDLLTEASQSLRPSDQALLTQKISRATDLAFRAQEQVRVFFNTIGEFAEYQRDGKGNSNYAWQERIVPSTRLLPEWEDVEITWDSANTTLKLLLSLLKEIYQAGGELYQETGEESLEDVMSLLGNIARRLAEVQSNVDGLIMTPAPEMVYWVEIHPKYNRLTLHAAPLHVGSLIEKHIWHKKESVILTSATLTTHGTFDYMREALGATDAETLALGSPFDYEGATLLYLPNDIPEPNRQGYSEAMEDTLVQLATATGGRLLALFTSYAQLQRASRAISGPLKRKGILVFEQGGGASPNSLLESFKESDAAVLLGTRSFWEGVDIPGDDLSVVALTKIPFGVPSDPLIAARSELYENAFHQYYLPEAILQFRQGFGRLIRSAQDRGVVVIFDRRVQTKQYGRLFIESLPQCTTRVGPLHELADVASQWLGV